MKLITRLVLALFLITAIPSYSQDDHRKERRKILRKWSRKKQAYNPYLDRKAKNKPSAMAARENKREMRRMEKRNRRQMKHSKRGLGRKRR